jgi:ATP-dependent Clp protease ATP-binding subunit ClpC
LGTKTFAFDFSTWLVHEELWGGGHLVFPVAHPNLSSYGEALTACLAEQRLFLEDHLSRADADEVASFSLPAGISLHMVLVNAPRHDLPPRFRRTKPVDLCAVVVPYPGERWAFLPALDHMVHLGRDDELEATIRAEAERLIAGLEPSPGDYLNLLPARSYALEELILHIERSDAAFSGHLPAAKKAARARRDREEALAVLEAVGTPIHTRPEARSGPELVGREQELALLTSLLNSPERNGVLLVGPQLVGKSALLEAWLRQELRKGNGRLAFALSGARLIAGMSGLGQWQERIQRIMTAAEKLDAVLHFEQLEDLFSQYATESVSLPNSLKPFLEANRVRVTGEITPEGLDLHERTQPGFFACFSRTHLRPLDSASTLQALRRWQADAQVQRPEIPNLTEDALLALMDMTERYIPDGSLPGKAIRLADELRALHQKDVAPDGSPRPIGRDKVYQALSLRTGVPEFLLRDDRALEAPRVVEDLERHLVGQRSAVERVVQTLCVAKAGLQQAGKPLASFLFIGPTGVGKTELARLLATFLFGAPDRMFRFDMSEFTDMFAAERLIRGTDRSDGLLTRSVRQQPFCVLLLDEIEKASSAVFDLLLQVLGEGRLSDAKGRTAFFHNAIIVMTSNIGAVRRASALGIGATAVADDEHYLSEIRKVFRPELINRIDQIVPFRSLSEEQLARVASLTLTRITERRGFLQNGLELSVGESALASLVRGGYVPAYGARALRRHLEQHLVGPIARAVGAAGRDAQGARVTVLDKPSADADQHDGPVRPGLRVDTDALRIELGPRHQRVVRSNAAASVNDLRAFRRDVDRLMELEPVVQLFDHVAFLLAQLATDEPEPTKKEGGSSKRRQKAPAEITRLQTEYHRLHTLCETAEQIQGDLVASEELALTSLHSGNDLGTLAEEARKLDARFRGNLFYLVFARHERRDEITLQIQEGDDGRAMDTWLVPFLESARKRRWTVRFRIETTEASKGKKAERAWGPEQPGEAWPAILKQPSRPRNWLLSCSGSYAGILLALEAGVHRVLPSGVSKDPLHFVVRTLARRVRLTGAELRDPVSRPSAPPLARVLAAGAASREYADDDTLRIDGGARELSVLPAEYWERIEQIAVEHYLSREARGGFDFQAELSGALPETSGGKP